MIAVPAGMRVLVATRPIDFRKGADGLVALVSETLRAARDLLAWSDERRQDGSHPGTAGRHQADP